MKQTIYIYAIILLSFFSQNVTGQDNFPVIYTLGQDDSKMIENYQNILLTACEDDLEKAFGEWMKMMVAIENYAHEIEFTSLKGTKFWIKVLWDKDGKIDHLGYFLNPSSRFVPEDELNAFFKSFVNNYTFPIKASSNYHHYGKVSFPTFYKIPSEEKIVDGAGNN